MAVAASAGQPVIAAHCIKAFYISFWKAFCLEKCMRGLKQRNIDRIDSRQYHAQEFLRISNGVNTPRARNVFRIDIRAWRRRGCRDDGVGLAAPQVGVNVRLMVFNAEGVRGSGEELLLANPRIISSGKGQDVDQVNATSSRSLSWCSVAGRT